MANIQSAKKRIRQTKRRTETNRMFRVSARTYIKKTLQLLAAGELDEAEKVANQAYETLDKASRRRIIHPNNAARRKGRLMAALAEARQQAAG